MGSRFRGWSFSGLILEMAISGEIRGPDSGRYLVQSRSRVKFGGNMSLDDPEPWSTMSRGESVASPGLTNRANLQKGINDVPTRAEPGTTGHPGQLYGTLEVMRSTQRLACSPSSQAETCAVSATAPQTAVPSIASGPLRTGDDAAGAQHGTTGHPCEICPRTGKTTNAQSNGRAPQSC